MCGIVGYTGGHEASPNLLAGLRRLGIPRGYDKSAGLATLDGSHLTVRKRAGRVAALEEALVEVDHPRRTTAGSATPDGPRTARPTTSTPTPTSAAKGPRPWRSSTTA